LIDIDSWQLQLNQLANSCEIQLLVRAGSKFGLQQVAAGKFLDMVQSCKFCHQSKSHQSGFAISEIAPDQPWGSTA